MACASTLFPRTRLYCSNCGEFVGTERITNLICSRKLGACISLAVFLSSAARRAHGSSAEHAMRDLIASNAPLREGSHKARQNPPKHYPRGFKGPQPLGTPFSPIFRRATKDRATGGRSEKRMPVNSQNKKTWPPEVVLKREYR